MTEILLLAITISGLSLGFRAITSPKMIFYFLRKPFDKLSERKKYYNDWLESIDKELDDDSLKEDHEDLREIRVTVLDYKPDKFDWILYLGKPVILCATCITSLHTLIWFPILTETPFKGLLDQIDKVVAVMLIAALLNTLIWSLIELIQALTASNTKESCDK